MTENHEQIAIDVVPAGREEMTCFEDLFRNEVLDRSIRMEESLITHAYVIDKQQDVEGQQREQASL